MTGNFFALLHISRRNQIRRDDGWLPLLSVTAELAPIRKVEAEKALDRIEVVHGAEVKAQVLARRGLTGKRLSWMVGMSVANDVRKILKAQLKQQSAGQ